MSICGTLHNHVVATMYNPSKRLLTTFNNRNNLLGLNFRAYKMIIALPYKACSNTSKQAETRASITAFFQTVENDKNGKRVFKVSHKAIRGSFEFEADNDETMDKYVFFILVLPL